MSDVTAHSSARQQELLERAYRYVLEHGIAGMSLRPLAQAIGSSPRVLLYLFDSKEGLVRALLARAREEELALLAALRARGSSGDLADAVSVIWAWLAGEEHRALLRLWAEGYARSLIDPGGPWSGFAEATVMDWLELLAAAQSTDERNTEGAVAERTLALAVLRGALLDLLATDDLARATAAVQRYMDSLYEGHT